MNKPFWAGILIVCTIMLIVLGLSYPFLKPGTPTYVIFQLSLIHVVAAMVIISTLLYVDWDPFSSLR